MFTLAVLLFVVAPTPTTIPSFPVSIVSPGPRTLQDVARERKLKTGGAGSFSATSTSGGVPLPSTTPSARSSASADTSEAEWRARFDSRRRDAMATTSEYVRMADSIPVVYHRNGNVDAAAYAAREATLAPYKLRMEDAAAALARLPEECRTTPGCNPGWIR